MTATIPSRSPRIVCTVFAVGGLLCASVISYPTHATAEPNSGSWDIEAYDDCMANMPHGPGADLDIQFEYMRLCCIDSGGVWTGGGAGSAGTCVAPAGEVQSPQDTPNPRSSLPTVSVQPPSVGTPTGTRVTPNVPGQPPTMG